MNKIDIFVNLLSGFIGVIATLFWNGYSKKAYLFKSIKLQHTNSDSFKYGTLTLTNVGEQVVTKITLSAYAYIDQRQTSIFEKEKIIMNITVPPQTSVSFMINQPIQKLTDFITLNLDYEDNRRPNKKVYSETVKFKISESLNNILDNAILYDFETKSKNKK